MNCVWLIIAEAGSRIHLIFSDFDVEPQFDYLIVKDDGMPEPTTFGTFSGKDVPSQIASNGNIMRLEFQSDHSNTGKGFNITYTSKHVILYPSAFSTEMSSYNFLGESQENVSSVKLPLNVIISYSLVETFVLK